MNTYTKNHDNTLVTILGDSVGKGIYTDNGRLEVLPENPAKVTAEKFGITIDNRSKYGQTLSRLTARGEENALFSQNSAATGQTRKIAVVELGGNDADFDWKEVASSPEADHAPKTDPERFTELYRELILKLRRSGVEPIACTILPVLSERYFSNVISKLADGDRVLRFLGGDVNTIQRHQEVYNSAIISVARELGVPIIDIRTPFLWSRNASSLMCRDGVHPSEKGSALIAATVEKFVRSRRSA